jgi:hypothetical protein
VSGSHPHPFSCPNNSNIISHLIHLNFDEYCHSSCPVNNSSGSGLVAIDLVSRAIDSCLVIQFVAIAASFVGTACILLSHTERPIVEQTQKEIAA